jgi:putative phosphoribosyl transferase
MFTDREEAGLQLARKLLLTPAIQQIDRTHLLVLSIPRGGVVIGQIVAQALGCQHNIVVVKKIGFPGSEELAVGAIAEDGPIVVNRPMLAEYRLTMRDLERPIARTRAKVDRYIHLFRRGEPLDLVGKTVILVDDGIATGETLKAAVRWVSAKTSATARIIVAVPVCSPSTAEEVAHLVDDVVCVLIPRDFFAVGQFYVHFEQVNDRQVLDILQRASDASPDRVQQVNE